MQEKRFRAMGSQMLATIDSPFATAADSLARVPERFAAWERILTSYSEQSELSSLNRSQGRPVQVSDVLWNVLASALKAAQLTGGLVTPATVTLASDSQPPIPTALERDDPADWRSIKLDPRKRTVFLPEGVRIDLGGTAKGWAADRTAALLGRQGPALVDVGGDIAVSGSLADGSHWPIGVADPLKDGDQLDLLMLRSGGIATAGRNYRKWRQESAWRHHTTDSGSGEPAGTDVLSATVIARSAQEAEVAARAAVMLGSTEGMAWVESRNYLAGLLVLEDGRVLRSRLLKYYTVDG